MKNTTKKAEELENKYMWQKWDNIPLPWAQQLVSSVPKCLWTIVKEGMLHSVKSSIFRCLHSVCDIYILHTVLTFVRIQIMSEWDFFF